MPKKERTEKQSSAKGKGFKNVELFKQKFKQEIL